MKKPSGMQTNNGKAIPWGTPQRTIIPRKIGKKIHKSLQDLWFMCLDCGPTETRFKYQFHTACYGKFCLGRAISDRYFTCDYSFSSTFPLFDNYICPLCEPK